VSRLNIYIASQYSRRLEMAAYVETLTILGHSVTSRWVSGAHESPIPDDALHLPEHRAVAAAFATEDWEDIQAAHLVLAFTEPPLPFASRGGRHVEAGMALAWGKLLWIVGPLENVFYALPGVRHFATWPLCLEALKMEAPHVS
jgi:hypothetical protein